MFWLFILAGAGVIVRLVHLEAAEHPLLQGKGAENAPVHGQTAGGPPRYGLVQSGPESRAPGESLRMELYAALRARDGIKLPFPGAWRCTAGGARASGPLSAQPQPPALPRSTSPLRPRPAAPRRAALRVKPANGARRSLRARDGIKLPFPAHGHAPVEERGPPAASAKPPPPVLPRSNSPLRPRPSGPESRAPGKPANGALCSPVGPGRPQAPLSGVRPCTRGQVARASGPLSAKPQPPALPRLNSPLRPRPKRPGEPRSGKACERSSCSLVGPGRHQSHIPAHGHAPVEERGPPAPALNRRLPRRPGDLPATASSKAARRAALRKPANGSSCSPVGPGRHQAPLSGARPCTRGGARASGPLSAKPPPPALPRLTSPLRPRPKRPGEPRSGKAGQRQLDAALWAQDGIKLRHLRARPCTRGGARASGPV